MSKGQCNRTASKSTQNLRYRLIGLVACGLAVAACLTYALVRSNLEGWWWRDHGGGIPYVFFWAAFLFMALPRPERLATISLVATLGTCALEFLQLWKPDWLTRIRATPFGAALLGSGFTWQDLPPYFLGGLLGFGILKAACQFLAPLEDPPV